MESSAQPVERRRLGGDDRMVATLKSEARRGELTIRVIGDCMRPLLAPNAEVRVRGARFYWPGDIVAFASRAGELTVHRLVGYRLRDGRFRAITMPDSPPRPDASIPFSRVLGRVTGGDCDRRAVDVPWADRWLALRRFARAAWERIGR